MDPGAQIALAVMLENVAANGGHGSHGASNNAATSNVNVVTNGSAANIAGGSAAGVWSQLQPLIAADTVDSAGEWQGVLAALR